LEKVYQNYKEILEDYGKKNKVYFINGEKSINEVFEGVKKVIEKKI